MRLSHIYTSRLSDHLILFIDQIGVISFTALLQVSFGNGFDKFEGEREGGYSLLFPFLSFFAGVRLCICGILSFNNGIYPDTD